MTGSLPLDEVSFPAIPEALLRQTLMAEAEPKAYSDAIAP